MESTLAESTARAQKSEREYITLRDSLKGLTESFKADQAALRDEIRKREEKMKKEAEEVKKKYVKLVDEVKKEREEGGAGLEGVRKLKEEVEQARHEVEEGLRVEIQKLRDEVDRTAKEDNGAVQTAKCVPIPRSHSCPHHNSSIGTLQKNWPVFVVSCGQADRVQYQRYQFQSSALHRRLNSRRHPQNCLPTRVRHYHESLRCASCIRFVLTTLIEHIFLLCFRSFIVTFFHARAIIPFCF